MKKVEQKPFTTVIGVDGKYSQQLETVIPNWRAFRPEIFRNPIVLFYDPVTLRNPVPLLRMLGPTAELAEWNPDEQFRGQRHKMLSGHVAIPALYVRTDWWLKIDCDAYAVDRKRWFYPDWFDGTDDIIAPSWGYTKPPEQMQELDNWADGVPALKGFPRLDLPFDERKCRHPRFCSWVMFGRTSFAKWAFELFDGNVCPVPSQDGYHFYVAKRAGKTFKTVKVKKFGWRNTSRLENLKSEIQQIGKGSSDEISDSGNSQGHD